VGVCHAAARRIGPGIAAVGGRGEDLDRPREDHAALDALDNRPDALAGNGAGDQDHLALVAAEHAAARHGTLGGDLERARHGRNSGSCRRARSNLTVALATR
jgi:hypothetical protein